jgi:hypothetical protein
MVCELPPMLSLMSTELQNFQSDGSVPRAKTTLNYFSDGLKLTGGKVKCFNLELGKPSETNIFSLTFD